MMGYIYFKGALPMNHPRMEDLKIAGEVKDKLLSKGKIQILDFRLFGSRARGTADWDSDLDLYVEVEAINRDQRFFINEIAWEIGFAKNIIITPVVVTRKQLENTPIQATPFYQIVKKEGIVI